MFILDNGSYLSKFCFVFQELLTSFMKHLGGKFRQAVLWSFHEPAQVNALAIHKALVNSGDEQILIEVVCSSNNQEISDIREAYARCTFLVRILFTINYEVGTNVFREVQKKVRLQ